MKMNQEKRANLLFQVLYRNEESNGSTAESNLVVMDEYLRIYHNRRPLDFNKERNVLDIAMRGILDIFDFSEINPILLRYDDRPIYHKNMKMLIGNQSIKMSINLSPTKKYDIYRILEICNSFISDISGCDVSFIGECGSYDVESCQYEYDICYNHTSKLFYLRHTKSKDIAYLSMFENRLIDEYVRTFNITKKKYRGPAFSIIGSKHKYRAQLIYRSQYSNDEVCISVASDLEGKNLIKYLKLLKYQVTHRDIKPDFNSIKNGLFIGETL